MRTSPISVRETAGPFVRLSTWLAACVLVLAALMWPQMASAQVVSPRCPTPFSLSVANSGSGTVNANACHEGFGIGFVTQAPLHGSVSVDTLASTVTYTHNGDSATSDAFRFDDGSGFYVHVNVTIGPASSITISPVSLPAMTAGTAFNQALTASGGTGPYTYSLSAGTLPTGLTLSSGGVLSGTPTQRGSFSFSITATDSTAATGTKSYTPTVAGGTLSITPNPPPNATISVPYSQALTPAGGVSPMTLTWEPNGSFPLPPGLSITGNTLSGTPTATGTYTFGVRITDSSTGPGSWFQVVNVTMTVAAAPTIVVNPATVPGATAGAAYSQTMTASGGTAPYSFAISAGALPAGLTLAANGTLSGTPTAAGTFNYTIRATDANSFSGTRAYTLVSGAPTIAIAPTSVPGATLGVPYSQSVTASGGTAPYGFTVTAGALPPGLTLAGNGTMSGTPTATGTFNFTVMATDSSTGTGAPFAASRAYSLIVAAPTISVAPASLPGGTVGAAYSQSITASGGSAPYTFAVTAGALPAGLTLAADGTLSGTPSAGGNFNFTVTATDNFGSNGSRAYTLTVSAPVITITPSTLFNPTVATAYSQAITASGGTATYTYAVTAGTLPPGMTLSSGGVLGGTPQGGGAFNFTIGATDSSTGTGPYTGSRAYAITVSAPAITLSPASLPNGTFATAYSQSITAGGGVAPYSHAVTAGALPPGMALASDGTLSGTPTTTGTFNFTVTATDSGVGTGPYSGSRAYTVTIADLAPIANAVAATVAFNSASNPITLNITGGTPDAVAIVAAPANGTAIASGTSITYTPTTGFAGSDSFTYTATNSAGTSAPATVSITVGSPTVIVAPTGPLGGMVGTAFAQTFAFSGGTAPYTALSVTGLPAGVAVTGTTTDSVTVSGTPTQSGSFTLVVSGTDSSTGSGPFTTSQNVGLTVLAPALSLPPSGGPIAANVGAPFSQAFTASGGTAPFSYAITAGSLPGGLSFNTGTGQVSGTPGAPGTFNFTVTATDSSTGTGAPFSVSASYAIAVAAPVVISPSTVPDGTAGVPYSQTFTASGLVAPLTFTVSAGALPTGMTLSPGGDLAGTTTATGTFNFTVRVRDAGGTNAEQAYTLVIVAPTIVLAPTTLPGGVAGTAYSQALTASGGVAPYGYGVVAGALPAGMSLASTGVLDGTPTVAGTFNFTVRATDSNGFPGDQAYSLTIAAPTIVIAPATLPDALGGTAYSQTFTATGGAAPHTWSLAAGALPPGMSLSSAGVLSGTPTAAGTFNFTVQATDANGFAGAQAYSLVVAAPTIALDPATLPSAVAGVAFNQTITASGGTAAYTFSLVTGSLPVGMSFSSAGVLAGTPTVAGTFSFTVRATDAFGFSGDQAYSLVIAAPTVVLSPATLPDGVAGGAYNQAITASGGSGPYTFSLVSGALPVGMTFSSAGLLSGTPTVAGGAVFTVRATDANGFSGVRDYTLTIVQPTIVLAPSTLPNGAVGTVYNQAITASGGNGTYVFGSSGALPPGLALGSTGVLSGTPTSGGSYTFLVRATDAFGFFGEQTYTVDIAVPAVVLAPATLSNGVGGTAYSQTVTASGGTGPYAFFAVPGALPPGLSLDVGGVLSGTPTVAGSFTFTLQAVDVYGVTGEQTYTVVITAPAITVTPSSLDAAAGAVPYSASLAAVGGTAPYAFDVVSGALPAGLVLDSSGVLSGTPAASGTFAFSVRATDALGFSGIQDYTLIVVEPTVTVTPATLPGGEVGTAYSQTLSASGGAAPYQFTVTAGTLPPGLSLDAGGVLSGTPSAAGNFAFDVTATDAVGFTGAVAYQVEIVEAVPVAVADSASTYAGSYVVIPVAANDRGVIRDVLVVAAPSHGAALEDVLSIVYHPAPGFVGTDSFTYHAIGPGGTSNVATVTVEVRMAPVPVGVAQTVTTLAGQAVSFDAAAGATGSPFTGVTLVSAPITGTIAVSGTTITYTPPADASGAIAIGYTLDNAFGPSAPITSTVNVNPLPMAMAHSATTVVGVPVQVELTQGATGGPFTAADVVSVSPAAAGTTQVTTGGTAQAPTYTLVFTPAADFTGTAVVRYTLDNAFATSAPADVTIVVTERPDPTRDAEVTGLLNAQTTATKRFALGQIDNFQSRMERLHDGGGQGFSNGLTVAITSRCHDGRPQRPGEACADEPLALPGANAAAPGPEAPVASRSNAPFGVWTAGGMAFGDYDLLGGNGFEFETSAISAGMDYRFSSGFVLGGGLGYGRDVTDVGEDGTRSEATAHSFALYGSHPLAQQWFLDMLLGYQDLSFDARRHVTATGGMVEGERDGDQWFASLVSTYEHREEAYTLAPYLRVDVARATLDAFTEQGDPIYALHYGEQDVNTTTGNLGVRMEFHNDMGWGVLSPMFRVEYQYDFEDPGVATLSYADLLGGPVYRTRLQGLDTSRLLLGLGAILQTEHDWLLKAEFRGLLGSHGQDEHSILINVEKEF